MKPFDLEAALRGEKVVTRDGREVTNLVVNHMPVTADVDGHKTTYTRKGTFWESGHETGYDLFMAPKTKTVWLNRYTYKVVSHYSKEEADLVAGQSRIGEAVPYTYEIE